MAAGTEDGSKLGVPGGYGDTCVKADHLGGPQQVLPVPAHHLEAVGCVGVEVQQGEAPAFREEVCDQSGSVCVPLWSIGEVTGHHPVFLSERDVPVKDSGV